MSTNVPSMEIRDNLQRLYPEFAAGEFTRDDHQVLFYSRIRALLSGKETVLDYGAGRGKFADIFSDNRFKLELVSIRGTCGIVVGGDVDSAVARNPLVDTAVIWSPDGALPFSNASFDLVVSWAVFEHIEEAERCAREIERVLRPGGWLCAWTPNKWGIAGVGARLVPNRWHAWVLRKIVRSRRVEADLFPTRYRMNTLRQLHKLFPQDRFLHASYAMSGPPAYVGRSRLATAAARVYQSFPRDLTATFLHIFIQKR